MRVSLGLLVVSEKALIWVLGVLHAERTAVRKEMGNSLLAMTAVVGCNGWGRGDESKGTSPSAGRDEVVQSCSWCLTNARQ